jgi:hypothetical protein
MNFEFLIFRIRLKFKEKEERLNMEAGYHDSVIRKRNLLSKASFYKNSVIFEDIEAVLDVFSVEIGKVIYWKKKYLLSAKSDYHLKSRNSSELDLTTQVIGPDVVHVSCSNFLKKFGVENTQGCVENLAFENGKNWNYMNWVCLYNDGVITLSAQYMKRGEKMIRNPVLGTVIQYFQKVKFFSDLISSVSMIISFVSICYQCSLFMDKELINFNILNEILYDNYLITNEKNDKCMMKIMFENRKEFMNWFRFVVTARIDVVERVRIILCSEFGD